MVQYLILNILTYVSCLVSPIGGEKLPVIINKQMILNSLMKMLPILIIALLSSVVLLLQIMDPFCFTFPLLAINSSNRILVYQFIFHLVLLIYRFLKQFYLLASSNGPRCMSKLERIVFNITSKNILPTYSLLVHKYF